MGLRGLVGVLVVGAVIAVGYVLVKGPGGTYQVGGASGFYLSGWKVLLGSLGIIVGAPTFASGILVRPLVGRYAWGRVVVGGLVLAGVFALIVTASFEAPAGYVP